MSWFAKPDWTRHAETWPNNGQSCFVTAGGLRWHIQNFGHSDTSGPNYLLLHGTGAAGHSWRDVAPQLAKEGAVMVPDLPGHGFTETPERQGLTLKGMTSLLDRLLRDQNFKPDIIIAHSAGAALAVSLALHSRLSLAGLVSINGALFPFRGAASPFFSFMARLVAYNPFIAPMIALRAGDPVAVRRLIRQTGSEIDARGEACYRALMASPGHVDAVLKMMAHWDVSPLTIRFKDLGMPLLVGVSHGDLAVPPSEGEKLLALAPTARALDLGEYGHLVHEEDPDFVVEVVRKACPTLERL